MDTVVINIIEAAPEIVTINVIDPPVEQVVINISDPDSVPRGGTAGQILSKASGTDYHTVWIDLPSINVGANRIGVGNPSTGIIEGDDRFTISYDQFGRPYFLIKDTFGRSLSMGNTNSNFYIQSSHTSGLPLFIQAGLGSSINLEISGDITYNSGGKHVFTAGGTSLEWNGDQLSNLRFVHGYVSGNLVSRPVQNLDHIISGYNQSERSVWSFNDTSIKNYVGNTLRTTLKGDYFYHHDSGTGGEHGIIICDIGGVNQGRVTANGSTGEFRIGGVNDYFTNIYSASNLALSFDVNGIGTFQKGAKINVSGGTEISFSGSSGGTANIHHETPLSGLSIGVHSGEIYFTTNNFSTYALTLGSTVSTFTTNINSNGDVILLGSNSAKKVEIQTGISGGEQGEFKILSDAAHATSLKRWFTGGNVAGTIIPYYHLSTLSVTNTLNQITGLPLAIRAGIQYGITGEASIDRATRLDIVGFKISSLSDAHNACTHPFQIGVSNGDLYYNTSGTLNIIPSVSSQYALVTVGKISLNSIPTSSAGLSAGDVYNDAGTLKIV